MIKLRTIILIGLLSLPLLHSGVAHSAIIGSYTGGETTLWTWDSFLVPLDNPTTTFTMNGAGSFEVMLVPIPPAIWLLGSGLLGLIGVSRRNRLN